MNAQTRIMMMEAGKSSNRAKQTKTVCVWSAVMVLYTTLWHFARLRWSSTHNNMRFGIGGGMNTCVEGGSHT